MLSFLTFFLYIFVAFSYMKAISSPVCVMLVGNETIDEINSFSNKFNRIKSKVNSKEHQRKFYFVEESEHIASCGESRWKYEQYLCQKTLTIFFSSIWFAKCIPAKMVQIKIYLQWIAHEMLTSGTNTAKLDYGHNQRHLGDEIIQIKHTI